MKTMARADGLIVRAAARRRRRPGAVPRDPVSWARGVDYSRFGRSSSPANATAATIERTNLQFLDSGRFRLRNLSIQGLEKLGFPWILSSETSLF